ncbi:MAG: TlpA family protein disulfide reductase [Gemmatimonadales bacterium]|nr:MAG: TlpA family protein disulfide reductase [Gemmatimonadales bacterium]
MMHPTSRANHTAALAPALPERLRLLGFVLLATLLTLLLPGAGAAQGTTVSLPLGTAVPDVALEDLDGNPVQLSDYLDGKPALIEFWASWCENCEALQPQLDEIQARYGERVSVVAVAVAVSQSQRRVRRHLEDHEPGYPFLWDGRGNAVRAFQAATTSIVVLVDGEGRVAYTGVGGSQDLLGAVEELLGS